MSTTEARPSGAGQKPHQDDRPTDGSADRFEAWRGVSAEGDADLANQGTVFLRQRSRRLLGDLLRPYHKTIVFMVFAVLVENGARLSIPWLVSRGIDRGVPPILAGRGAQALFTIVAVMLLAVAFQTISRIVFLRTSGGVGQNVLLELRRRVFKHFQRLDVAFHDRYTSGRVVSRLTSDVDAIQELLATGFDSLINAVLTMIGVAVLMVLLDVKLGLVCLLCFPFLLLLSRWFSRNSADTYRKVRESSALTIVQFVETMTGIRAVQAYRREPRNQDIFADVAGQYRDVNTRSFRLVAVFMPGIKLIGNITIGVVVLYGGYRALEGDVTIGVLAAFLLYLRMFFEPMQNISQFYNTFLSASSALEKLSGVLEEEPSVPEPKHPKAIGRARGEVRFDHVHFTYVADRPVLPDLDLTIPKGQTLALVGTTGAGKTTIAKLMSRFYDPTEGRVLLDGIDLRELSDEDLRRNVVMVTQENFMFDGTVGENIAFGKPSAPQSEIERAAAAVGADTFIDLLPEGYNTDVGKRGERLSAGQRQLIAFARAFLADPAVLILDEATSSLDIPSERLVQRALQTILAERTAVIIAHRLSTVEIADRVLVLEHGQIVEDGSPAELTGSTDSRYAALHNAWVESLA
ncbi:ABC-type multidrug transport system fused ATPase/permease subunit [Friedmanniella endophytica]|uniref:ABC-type multidrug transport system fused ATPase/permease subunit n=1 Tax=Microlunatus kandeliicorticis TaxID=1759536 RepID=A0A7W3IQS2_9ACTN|nr:ABC transporter ATP-binding protein [Microlunatus kandeliicorticis]MBA8793509.1 ABC-type multidrug transport system fused ATPase/permease subunit [Microlunatus kandeliicorticis]